MSDEIYTNMEEMGGDDSTNKTRTMDVDDDTYETLDASRLRSRHGVRGQHAGRNIYRLVALILGLLCVLQASLNIYQKASYNTLTEERDQLRARNDNLTEERDQLKKDIEGLNERIRVLGWRTFGGSWYNFICNERRTWEESRQDCLSRGAHLVVINSREEQTFINSLIGGSSRAEPWIGLTDREREGTWTWVDGTPLTTSFWEEGRPDGYKGTDQDCVEFWSRPDGQPVWNDEECSVENEWICEK